MCNNASINDVTYNCNCNLIIFCTYSTNPRICVDWPTNCIMIHCFRFSILTEEKDGLHTIDQRPPDLHTSDQIPIESNPMVIQKMLFLLYYYLSNCAILYFNQIELGLPFDRIALPSNSWRQSQRSDTSEFPTKAKSIALSRCWNVGRQRPSASQISRKQLTLFVNTKSSIIMPCCNK